MVCTLGRNKRWKQFRLSTSPAKTIGNQGHVRNDLKLLKYQEPKQVRGREKAGSNWITVKYYAYRTLGLLLFPFFSSFAEGMISQIQLGSCQFAFSYRTVPPFRLLRLPFILGTRGTLTYFQEQNLFQKVPSEEGPPPALLPSCCPSASPMRVQSAPCFKCVLPEVVFTKIRRRVCFPVFLTQKLASHAHALGFSETTPYCTETFYNDRSFGQPHFILLLIELLVICYSCVILPCA